MYFIDEETFSEKLNILPNGTSVLSILFLQNASEVPKDLAGTRLVVEGASPCKRMEVLKLKMFREG